MRDRLPFDKHLEILSSSFFCISPDGNGLDCHRHWEALYLKTIPIVTKSFLVESLKREGFPFLILDEWSDFNSLELSPKLYNDIWKDFDLTTFQQSLHKKLSTIDEND